MTVRKLNSELRRLLTKTEALRAVANSFDPPDATSGKSKASELEEDDYLTLSTIHSAKGGEWKYVRVLNVVEGCIPSSKATNTPEEIEEERRLLYVAMTRAKQKLDLIVPVRYFTYQQSNGGDSHYYGAESRFIPKSVQRFFDRRNWQPRSGESMKPQPKRGPRIDVSGELIRFWR